MVDSDQRRNYERAVRARDYWESLQRRSNLHPFFHPPDLFAIDPCVVKPYCVPKTFVPIPVGGNIEIYDQTGGRVKSEGFETKEFILANFLPGGYKKRWEFQHYRAVWAPSERQPVCANIGLTFQFEKSIPLGQVYTESETFSPLNIPVERTKIYFPDHVYVEKLPEHVKYYWDEERHIIHHHADTGAIEVVRDPLSTPLHINIMTDDGETSEPSIEFPKDSLIKKINYLETFVLTRCYYANCIHIFGKTTTTLTRLIRFYHDDDDAYALIGSEQVSQATRIEFSLKQLCEKILGTLQDNSVLQNDLRMQYVLLQLYESVLYRQTPLQSTYDIDKLYQLLIAVDYWINWTERATSLEKFFEQEMPEFKLILQELIPNTSETRLRLAGYDPAGIDDLIDLITENQVLFKEIFHRAFDTEYLKSFCNRVLYTTLEKAVIAWLQQFFGSAGEGLNYWHESNGDTMFFYAYDRYQGGSGIAKELFRKFQGLSPDLFDVRRTLERSLLCDINLTELVIHHLFLAYEPEFLVAGFNGSESDQVSILRLALEEIERQYGFDLHTKKREDLLTFCKIDIKRLVASEDIAAFYSELIRGYVVLLEKLRRTPTTIDLLLYCCGDTFYDPRAAAVFEKYRTRKKGDLSELVARIEEMMPTCINGCPECIEISSSYGQDPLGSALLNKRLLARLLEVQ
ncbi:MAG: Uncharacterized protein XE11_1473 [Methanomicrobiales archaeon 53_19]|nr:MAG: Uncharacterized protein XD88_0390 [Methanocalculus sp. 52_23]KUL03060.1 MAG: Uncharacterized protein XE11_1473 [Methanomicrobiales archaeon 53_19]